MRGRLVRIILRCTLRLRFPGIPLHGQPGSIFSLDRMVHGILYEQVNERSAEVRVRGLNLDTEGQNSRGGLRILQSREAMNHIDRAFIKVFSQHASLQRTGRSDSIRTLGDIESVRESTTGETEAPTRKSTLRHPSSRVPAPQLNFVPPPNPLTSSVPRGLHSASQRTQQRTEDDVFFRVDPAHVVGNRIEGEDPAVLKYSSELIAADPVMPAGSVKNDEAVVLPATPGISRCEPGSFRAAWEVDAFCWPEVVQDLLNSSEDAFGFAVRRCIEVMEAGSRTLALAAHGTGDGCTTVTLCLANCLVQAGFRVAVVDADVKQPDLAASLEVDVTTGWDSLMETTGCLQEVAVSSLNDGMTLVPWCQGAVQPITSPELQPTIVKMISDLTQHYDMVLIDAGTLDVLGLLLPQVIEGMQLIFVRNVRPGASAVAGDLRDHLSCGMPLLGIAENFAA